jgi:hypothetical protein
VEGAIIQTSSNSNDGVRTLHRVTPCGGKR